jgi:hypothetical protein
MKKGKDDPNFLTMLAQEALVSEHGVSYTGVIQAKSTDNTWGQHWNRNYNLCNYKNSHFEDFHGWYVRHVNSSYPETMRIIPNNGIFAVTKACIKRHPAIVYTNFIQLVDWHSAPIDAHFFERSWHSIFAGVST